MKRKDISLKLFSPTKTISEIKSIIKRINRFYFVVITQIGPIKNSTFVLLLSNKIPLILKLMFNPKYDFCKYLIKILSNIIIGISV